MKQVKSKMKHFTKEQQDLEDKREFLLLNIVKLKQKIRRKLLELGKQSNRLDRMANEIVVLDEKRLEQFAFELKQMWGQE